MRGVSASLWYTGGEARRFGAVVEDRALSFLGRFDNLSATVDRRSKVASLFVYLAPVRVAAVCDKNLPTRRLGDVVGVGSIFQPLVNVGRVYGDVTL
jgi:hypothetical protein